MNEIEKINKSILTINPNAQFTFKDNDINSITWLNGTTPISKVDIEAMIPTVEAEIANAEADAIAKKASGKQKLKDLGLDDDEIKALTGA
jgi:hypothetical protein